MPTGTKGIPRASQASSAFTFCLPRYDASFLRTLNGGFTLLHHLKVSALFALVCFFASASLDAQDPTSPEAETEVELPFDLIEGPLTADLGGLAEIDVPEGVSYVAKDDMDAFNEATGNLPSPSDMGALVADDGWIVFFSFDDIGYVKDDDQEELDADELLASMKKNDGPSNEMRREIGMDELFTDGWSRAPYYDSESNNLTWGLRLRTGSGDNVVNHQIRLLGRGGVMNVIVVDGPDTVEQSVASFEPMLTTFDFTAGNRYAEFVSGDRVAQVGLAALVAGGGVALAAKTGLLAALLKNIKGIGIGIVALFAAMRKRIAAFFGRGPVDETRLG